MGKIFIILLIQTWAMAAKDSLSIFMVLLLPIYLLFITLVLVDLRMGICAARNRGEKIRRSRAVRRTVSKLLDYCSIVTVCKMFDVFIIKEYDIPLVFITLCLLLAWVELDSIFSHFEELRGIKIRHFIRQFFYKKLNLKLPTKNNKNESK